MDACVQVIRPRPKGAAEEEAGLIDSIRLQRESMVRFLTSRRRRNFYLSSFFVISDVLSVYTKLNSVGGYPRDERRGCRSRFGVHNLLCRLP